MSKDVPPIREMPQDEHLWHLQGLGKVDRKQEAGVRIEVVMVRALGEAPRKADDFDYESAVTIKVFVGYLPLLTMGSFWRKGLRVDYKYPAQQIVKLTAVDVSPATSVETHLGHQPDGKYGLVPYSDQRFYFGKVHLGRTRVLGIRYNNDPFGIIVPMAELIRFYYARSSDLARAIFNGVFTHDANSIYNPDATGPMTIAGKRRMVVRRRKEFENADCWVIGRILVSPEANQGAKMVHDRLKSENLRNRPMFPASRPPFFGTTNWRLRGIHLRNGRWLVHELLGCTAPYPFEELEVIPDNDNTPGANDPPRAQLPEAFRGAHETRAAKDADRMDSTTAPNTTLVGIEVNVPSLSPDQFSDIAGKNIIHTEKAACRYKASSYGATIAPNQNTTSFFAGDPSYAESDHGEAKLTGGEGEDSMESRRAAALRASLPGLAAIAVELSQRGIPASLRRSTEDMYLPLLEKQQSTRKGRKKGQWAYLDSATQTRRSVRAFDVTTPNGSALLVEFQIRETENYPLAVFHGIDVSDALLEDLLRRLVEKKGRWCNIELGDGLKLARFKHSRATHADFAAAIARFLETLPESSALGG